LLPLEPEESLEDAKRLLTAMFVPSRTHVRRVYVQRPLRSDVFLSSEFAGTEELARLEFDAESATRALSEGEMKPFSDGGFEVSADVLHGSPRAEVLTEAALWRADLIAVRAHRREVPEPRIGQMASALLHHAPCPVLLYRAVPERFAVRRVLVPVDFSSPSRGALSWGLALASLTEARCDLLHVVDEGAVAGRIAAADLVRMAREELSSWRARGEPQRSGAEVVTSPTPGDGILAFAGHREYDLIVLPATGGSEVAAALLGSTVRRVLRGTSLPVLVLPPSNRIAVERFLERAGAPRSAALSTAPA
jgi:nucleotide-binding universal stress UspA family protein